MRKGAWVSCCLVFGLLGAFWLVLGLFPAPSVSQGKESAPKPLPGVSPGSSPDSEPPDILGLARKGLGGRARRREPREQGSETRPMPQGTLLLRGRLVGPKSWTLGGTGRGPLLRLQLDGRVYQAPSDGRGNFSFRGAEKPQWKSVILELPGEEFYLPIAGIDWVEGPPPLSSLLARARRGEVVPIPVLPWSEIRLHLEGPQGQALDRVRVFIRPADSPASLGKERYRLPGRSVSQDPPLGPGIAERMERGLFRCTKLPPRLPLHLLALARGSPGRETLGGEAVLPPLDPGQSDHLTLRLLPRAKSPERELWVLDKDGRPIPHAQVWLLDQDERSFGRLPRSPTKVGVFPFSAPHGKGRLRVWASGYQAGEWTFPEGESLPREMKLRLEKGGSRLRIQVQKNGVPQQGVILHAKELGQGPWTLSWTMTTDSRGMGTLSGLGKESGLLLYFGSWGRLDYGLGKDEVPDPPFQEVFNLDRVPLFDIERGARIAGTIQGFKGDPRALSLQASYRSPDPNHPWTLPLFNIPLAGTRTRKGFEFSQGGLPRGEYRIVKGGRTLTRFSLKPGDSILHFDLRSH